MATYYDYEKNFDTQSNYGWGLSFNMTGKVPAIHKRIFDTLEGAQAFADNYNDSAIPGLLLSIVNDENNKNNGVYFIKKIKSNETDTSAELVKLGTDISEIEEKINILIGEDNNKSVRTIANEELAKQLIPEDAAESLDTLQEIAQWIQEHPSDAAEMNEKIVELENTVNGYSSTNTLKDTIDSLNESISDTVILQEDIVVAGLTVNAGSYSNGDTISKGTNIYEILKKILCQELYPENVISKSATASASMNELTLTLNETNTVEVGTLITMTEGKTNGTEVNTTPSKIEGMTWGYSLENNSTEYIEDTEIEKECTYSPLEDKTYTISATIDSGFDADTTTNVKTTPETQTGDGSASLDKTDLGCAVEGENKITISATGASYSYHADAIDKVYYRSNLGNTDENKYNEGVPEVSDITDTPTNTTSKTVTGKYKYFFGYSEKTRYEDFTSDDIRGLKIKSDWIVKDGTTVITGEEKTNSNGKSIVVACPSKYKLSTFDSGVGASIIPNFTSVGNVSVKTGAITSDYRVYVYPITNNAVIEYKNITLKKV